jgi:hypothetical protein
MNANILWFTIVTLVVSVILIVVCALGIYYFNKVRTENGSEISSTTAAVLMGLNAFGILLGLLVFIWALVSLVTGSAKHA